MSSPLNACLPSDKILLRKLVEMANNHPEVFETLTNSYSIPSHLESNQYKSLASKVGLGKPVDFEDDTELVFGDMGASRPHDTPIFDQELAFEPPVCFQAAPSQPGPAFVSAPALPQGQLPLPAYTPEVDISEYPAYHPGDKQPVFPAYSGAFKTGEEARAYRKKPRLPAKTAEDLERVRRDGRQFWVQRLYNAMIDIRNPLDGTSKTSTPVAVLRFSDPRKFKEGSTFHPLEVEATAHKIFDACIRRHVLGWSKYLVYHKDAKRGKLFDDARSVELRLHRICCVLRERKTLVDDVMRGGLTLELLVDNPLGRLNTKTSNNNGNGNRGVRLREHKVLKNLLDGTLDGQ